LSTTAAPAPRRIGLMGGSFDPVHTAHVQLAEVALAHLQLDEVRWIPVGQAWQKARELAPAADRLAMVQAAIAHEPRFVADDIELRRTGPSYTLDTVTALQAAQPATSTQWWLVIGQDQCANLPTWRGWQTLLSQVNLAVACRGDEPVAVPDLVQMALAEPSLGDVQGAPGEAPSPRLVRLPMPPMAVSSTAIRQRLGAGASPLVLAPDLLPAAVASYIADHHLYAPRGRAPL
jgi:nicotinate-nucleotide adenylyltransferase